MTEQTDDLDWKDCNREVVVTRDGFDIPGRFECEEFFTGEDEIPIFTIVLADHTSCSPYDVQWRFK